MFRAVARLLPFTLDGGSVVDHLRPRVHRRLGSSVSPARTTWDDILSDIEAHPGAPVSFDVFDTLLSRRLATQDRLLAEIGAEIVATGAFTGDRPTYPALRATAEAEVGGGLDRWYASDLFAGRIDPELAIEAEMTVERAVGYAVPGAREAVGRIRAAGHPITFLSDMYLPSRCLHDLLVHHGLDPEPGEVVVSCEHDATKNRGSLYSVVWPDDEQRSRVVHVGNDRWADIARARAAGLHPVNAVAGNLDRYESLVAAEGTGDSGGLACDVIAAAAREARLHLDDPVERWGAGVAGLLTTAYVAWAQQVASEAGVDHLAYLARDGELPLLLAGEPGGLHRPDLRSTYLHTNRRVWTIASASAIGVDRWIERGLDRPEAFLRHRSHTTPLGDMLDRCGLTAADLPPSHADLDPARPLDLVSWRDLLATDRIRSTIDDRSTTRRELVTAAIRSHIQDGQRAALVDVGWSGQQAWAITELFVGAVGAAPLHLHFGGHGTKGVDPGLAEIRRFALDDSVRPHPVAHPVLAMEMLWGSGRPRLTGYRPAPDGRAVEVFSPSGSKADSPTLRAIWRGARETARRIRPFEPDPHDGEALAGAARAVLEAYWNHPPAPEVTLLDGLCFEHDDAATEVDTAIRPYQLSELPTGPAPRMWRQGSLAATAPPLRTLFGATLAGRDLVVQRRRSD